MAGALDTIFALSTVPGRSGIAVIRISGPHAGDALAALTGRPPSAPRKAVLTGFTDPKTGSPIDQGLVLWFPGPASFTGEDMAELHLHGGRAVIAAAVEALAREPGLRPAEPGEFTRRAFDNGKLDLSEVEGLADLIEAETEAQRRQALRQMAGGLSRLTEGWRDRLVPALAHMEASIDFSDEELPVDILAGAKNTAAAVAEEIGAQLADAGRGERLRDGLQIAILGPPNSGKSSLLNALAQRDVAIVSETAGTTRDVIEVHLDLGGYPVTLADTAGLRELGEDVGDGVELEGMRRARRRAEEADLRLVVFDVTTWPSLDSEALHHLRGESFAILNKVDLVAAGAGRPQETTLRGCPILCVSALTGDGLGALLEGLQGHVSERLGISGSVPGITRARHRQALETCRDALRRSLDATAPELAAEDLRLAVRALGRITGRVDFLDRQAILRRCEVA